jgi:hypothetical protein
MPPSRFSAPFDLPDWIPDRLKSIEGAGVGPSLVRYEGYLERLPLPEDMDMVHRSLEEWEE